MTALRKSNARILIPYLLGHSSQNTKPSQSHYQTSQNYQNRPSTCNSVTEPDLVTIGDYTKQQISRAGQELTDKSRVLPDASILLMCPESYSSRHASVELAN